MSIADIVYLTIFLIILALFIIFSIYRLLCVEIADSKKNKQKELIEFIRTVVKELNAENEKSSEEQSE